MTGVITETLDRNRGRYALLLNGAEAELTYHIRGDLMVIDHTFTPPVQRGQGIAGRLVERAVDDARARGWRIAPVCPYVKVKMERTPAMHDMIDPGWLKQG
ncbi:MAG: GNAT family N-acetyltransferase [Pseudomonadota bacterium]